MRSACDNLWRPSGVPLSRFKRAAPATSVHPASGRSSWEGRFAALLRLPLAPRPSPPSNLGFKSLIFLGIPHVSPLAQEKRVEAIGQNVQTSTPPGIALQRLSSMGNPRSLVRSTASRLGRHSRSLTRKEHAAYTFFRPLLVFYGGFYLLPFRVCCSLSPACSAREKGRYFSSCPLRLARRSAESAVILRLTGSLLSQSRSLGCSWARLPWLLVREMGRGED